MTAREQLIKEINQATDALVEEVLDFLCFVKTRRFPHAAVTNASLNQEKSYEKISRVKGLLCDRKDNLLTYASQVRQEWE